MLHAQKGTCQALRWVPFHKEDVQAGKAWRELYKGLYNYKVLKLPLSTHHVPLYLTEHAARKEHLMRTVSSWGVPS